MQRVVIDPRAPALVASAIELLAQDLHRHWTLDELADQLCIGPFHLVRSFKRWVGVPPIAWANRRRAERAAILLSTTDEPIAAIGAQVGWPDPSYFSRRFRQEFGVGARAYRVRSHEHQAAVHPGCQDVNDEAAADESGRRPGERQAELGTGRRCASPTR